MTETQMDRLDELVIPLSDEANGLLRSIERRLPGDSTMYKRRPLRSLRAALRHLREANRHLEGIG